MVEPKKSQAMESPMEEKGVLETTNLSSSSPAPFSDIADQVRVELQQIEKEFQFEGHKATPPAGRIQKKVCLNGLIDILDVIQVVGIARGDFLDIKVEHGGGGRTKKLRNSKLLNISVDSPYRGYVLQVEDQKTNIQNIPIDPWAYKRCQEVEIQERSLIKARIVIVYKEPASMPNNGEVTLTIEKLRTD